MFTTCFSGVDGKLYPLVIDWIKTHYEVDYVNLITEVSMIETLLHEKRLNNIMLKFIDLVKTQDHIKEIFIVGSDTGLEEQPDKALYKDRLKSAVDKVQYILPDRDVVGLWISGLSEITALT